MSYSGQGQTLNATAFGDVAMAEITGQIQLEFPVDLSLQIIEVTVASSGTVTSNPPFAVLSAGTLSTGSAAIQSYDRLHCKAGQGGFALFTAEFGSGVANNQQYAGIGDAYNGFFFGWNGSTFGILYRSSVYGATVTSITTVDTWIYQTSWSGDPLDGTGSSNIILNPINGNVYKIQMQGLGFGNINFFIESENDGSFILVHTISYANNYTNTIVSNPVLPLYAITQNIGNTTNSNLQIICMYAFIEGLIFSDDVRYSVSGNNNGFSNDMVVLCIQNMYTFNGVLNAKYVRPDFVSIFVDGATNPFLLRFTVNPLLSTSNYIQISAGNSVVQYYSPGAQTVSATHQLTSRTVAYLAAGVTGQINFSLDEFNIILNPGDSLSISSNSLVDASAVYCALSWVEEF